MTTTTTTTTGLFIPADYTKPCEVRELDPSGLLESLQTTVGGYVEVAHLEREELDMYLNEEGKISGQPFNKRATVVAFNLHWRHAQGDYITGDVMVLGGPDDAGDNQGLTPGQVKLMTGIMDRIV